MFPNVNCQAPPRSILLTVPLGRRGWLIYAWFFDNCKAPCRGTGTGRKPLGPTCSNNIIHGPVNKLTSRKMRYIINAVIKDGERTTDGYERRLLSWQCHPGWGAQLDAASGPGNIAPALLRAKKKRVSLKTPRSRKRLR